MSEDAMGGMPPMGGDPPGGDPMGGMSPMGGAPPGGDPMGGMPPMGADPMGGAPPGGAPGGQMPPTIIPKHADVWAVLDHILNRKPLEHDKQLKNQQSQQPPQQPPAPDMGTGPMPGAAGMPPQDPSAPSPAGQGQPALMS